MESLAETGAASAGNAPLGKGVISDVHLDEGITIGMKATKTPNMSHSKVPLVDMI